MPDAPTPRSLPDDPLAAALAASVAGGAVNLALAGVKIVAGAVGSSSALVADGIESLADVVSSLVVWGGLRLAARPPDETHPYGHGKVETLAGLLVAAALIAAAGLIAWQSVRAIRAPDGTVPALFTLPVLVAVIVLKLALSRRVRRVASDARSTALAGDAAHHLSDAVTSAAALIGITFALVGGPRWAAADDWAALVASAVILFNGGALAWKTIDELMDAAPSVDVRLRVEEVAGAVPGVRAVEKLWVRKYGLGAVVDIHVFVDGGLTVREGHRIAHGVKDALVAARDLGVFEVLVHVEPCPVPVPSPGTPGEG